ncbi:MAG: hypothetical protein QOG88_1241 [Actinomycetota bacterium]|jgi:hypothetical protein|nr:hypothetical protein [Actinomycetota bacterium]
MGRSRFDGELTALDYLGQTLDPGLCFPDPTSGIHITSVNR